MTIKVESSFEWTKIPEGYDKKYFVNVIAKTPSITDHRNDPTIPPEDRVRRIYSEDELHEAARSLSLRPINFSHNQYRQIKDAVVYRAMWHEDKVEAQLYIPYDDILGKLKNKVITHVSVESLFDEVKVDDETIEVKNLVFTGLALVEPGFNPGDMEAKIQPLNETSGFQVLYEISGVELAPEDSQVESVKETETPEQKRIAELETAVTKLQESVKTTEASINNAKAEAYAEGKKEVIEKVKEAIPNNLISNKWNANAIRLKQDINKKLLECV